MGDCQLQQKMGSLCGQGAGVGLNGVIDIAGGTLSSISVVQTSRIVEL
jgi:hypothetical protein